MNSKLSIVFFGGIFALIAIFSIAIAGVDAHSTVRASGSTAATVVSTDNGGLEWG
jgi:hypothetical protein